MSQINNSYSSGGMAMALNDNQFAAYIQHLKNAHHAWRASTAKGGNDNRTSAMWHDIHLATYMLVLMGDEEESNYVWIDQSFDSYHHISNDDSYHPTSTHLLALHLLNTCYL